MQKHAAETQVEKGADPTRHQLIGNGNAYDAAGNMTNDGVHAYTYDAEGNILQADGGQTGSYVYDALGRRARSQLAMWGGGYMEYVYDAAGRITSDWNTQTVAAESHIFADGTQIAYRSGDGKTYFNHKDWLDTDRVHTDAAGANAAAYTSLPFGDGGQRHGERNLRRLGLPPLRRPGLQFRDRHLPRRLPPILRRPGTMAFPRPLRRKLRRGKSPKLQ